MTAHLRRLKVLFDVFPAHANVGPQEAIVDTGSYLSVFPEKYWRKVTDRITFLKSATGGPLPSWLTTVSGVGGGKIPCQPGLLLVRVLDRNGRALSLANIVGKFAEDKGQIGRILLGLDGGILRDQGIEIVFDGQKVWLTEL